MKTRTKIIAAIAAAAAGAALFLALRPSPEGKVSWKAETVVLGDVEKLVTATGSVQPLEQVEISTEVSGTIAKIFVDFNDKVKKGQLIAQLDHSKLKATLAQQQASVDAAENEYGYQKKQRERTAALVARGAASQQDLDDADYKLENARTSLLRAKTQRDQAQVDLRNSAIRSPIDGVVLSREVEEGQTVAASMNAPTLFVVARSLSKMKVETSIDEADVGQVKPGQKVRFRVDAFPEKEFEGKLRQVRLSPVTTNNVVTYTVIIEADNPDGLLVPGLTANVDIVVASAYGVPTAPVSALRFKMPAPPSGKPPFGAKKPPFPLPDGASPPSADGAKAAGDGQKVWVLDGGFPRPRPVVVGVNDGNRAQIVSGLEVGDSVVVGQERKTAAASAASGSTNPFMPSPPKNRKSAGKSGPPAR